MLTEIKSNELKKKLELMLNKEYDKISLEDLNRIKDISLKKIDFIGEYTDCNLNDLTFLRSLLSCSLFKFEINETDIDILNKLSNVNYIYFDFCKFNIKNLLLKQSIETLYFNMCDNLELEKLENTQAKKIKIIGDKENKLDININDLKRANNLEELSIHNFKISNILNIINIAPKLKVLNLDGSIVEDINAINKLKEKIEISNEKEYRLTGIITINKF